MHWTILVIHDYVIKWRYFSRYWSFVRRIPRSPVDSPHRGQWRGVLMVSSMFAWTYGWVNSRDAHDDVIKWRHFPCYWPFVSGNHRSLVDSPYKGQWHETLMFSLMCAWTNGGANNRDAGQQLRCWWFETSARSLWRHCNVYFWHRLWSKKTSKLRVTGLCAGNSPGPVNSPHKGPVSRKMFPFDDVIMKILFEDLAIVLNYPTNKTNTNASHFKMQRIFAAMNVTVVCRLRPLFINMDKLESQHG